MIDQIRKKLIEVIGVEVGQITASDKPEFGDYSTNAAFLLARRSLGEGRAGSPLAIAQELAKKISESDNGKFFANVEPMAPGFVNFRLSAKVLQEELAIILKREAKYGATKADKSQKIQLEFVSANPTGPLTIANGRGGFLGDVLANVLSAAGHKVQREYYVNDAGNQIKLLGESILSALGRSPAQEEHYQGEYVKKLAKKLASKIKKQDSEEVGRLAAKELLAMIKKTAKKAGLKFNNWFSEYKELRQGGLIKKALSELQKKNLVSHHDGAVWLDVSEVGDEKDRVLVKSTGEPTYFLADMAYHYDKFINRGFDKVIDIWGADHHGYVARMKAGVKALGVEPERLEIVITQLVRLVRGGEEVKMSKRKGEFITLDELLDEVGADAARFFFLMHSPEAHMDFDLALAKERSQKNPVYYAQYAYVRALSILKRANSKSEIRNSKQILNSKFKTLSSETELKLIKELVKLPDVVAETVEDYQVHRLTRYAMEVARALHNFYEKERVLDAKGELRIARLALISAAKIVLENLFRLLGVTAPEKM